MTNASTAGESITLRPGAVYFVIDALYADDIRKAYAGPDGSNIEQEIREHIFPHVSTPYGKFIAQADRLTPANVLKANHEDISDTSIFATDTGLLLFLREDVFTDFVRQFDYDALTDVPVSLNAAYWDDLLQDFPAGSAGLLLNDSGSGVFRVA